MATTESQMSSASVQIRGGLLAVCFLGAVVPYFFSESDSARGIGLAGSCSLVLVLQLLFDSAAVSTLFMPTRKTFAILSAFAGIIGYGVLRALYHGNDQYYLLAELYHWLVELTFVAIVTRLALGGTAIQSAQGMTIACFLIGICTMLLVAGCYAGVVPGGGYFQAGSRFWHLKAGVNFPQIPLMLAWVALTRCKPIGSGYRFLARAALISCSILLVMTLKRTMWLSTVGCIACVTLPRGQLRQLATWAALVVVILVAGIIARGSEIFGFLDFMTYNESYSVTDTMEDRKNQLSDALRLFSVAGEGFGAEVDIYKVNSNKVERVHYIHSLYVFQIVQFGVPVGLICFGVFFWIIVHLQSISNNLSQVDWRIDAAIACLLSIAVNGVTLVSFHSAFAGVAFGVAFAAMNEQRRIAYYQLEEHESADFSLISRVNHSQWLARN